MFNLESPTRLSLDRGSININSFLYSQGTGRHSHQKRSVHEPRRADRQQER